MTVEMEWFDGTPGSPGQAMEWFDGTPGSPGPSMTWFDGGLPVDPPADAPVHPLDWIELEVDRCQLTYGVAPCQAELGVTGQHKCFNSLQTCQDPENYDPAPYWVRFADASSELPRIRDFVDDGVPWWLPSLDKVKHSPVKPDPGRSIGVRADVKATLQDHPYHDRGLDKYVDERGFDATERSTLWLKLLTRFPFYLGRRLRWHREFIGDAASEVTRHYVIETIEGPDRRGRVEVTAKDPLKLIDDDRAQAPRASEGVLDQDIAEGASPTTIDVATPDTGEYPSGGGIVFIGGEGFTYTGTTIVDSQTVRLTGVSRSLPAGYATEAKDHDVGDAVQLALFYDSQRLVDIVEDLLVTYVPRWDAAWIPSAEWSDEHDTWLSGQTLTRLIAEPEGVRGLIDEIVEQTLTWGFWWDEAGQVVRYRVIRPPDVDDPVVPLSDDNHLISGSVERIDEPKRVINIVQVVYGQVDPTRSRDERDNYRRAAIRANLDSLSEQQIGAQRIRRVFARWHPAGNQSHVDQLTVRTLAAGGKPFRLEFDLTRHDGDRLALADFVEVDTRWVIDELGLPVATRMQVLRASADGDVVHVSARRDVFQGVRAFGRIAPAALAGTTFATASDRDKQLYVFIADANGEMSDGSEGYRLL